MQDQIHIRQATFSDLEALVALSRETFSDSFAALNTAENMKLYMDANFSFENLSIELNEPSSEFYLAIREDKPVAYLKINYGSAQTEMKDQKGLEIERIYVLRSLQGQQLGQQLFGVALQRAKELGAAFLWLGVWEKNTGAIRFYERKGLKPYDTHLFRLGEDIQNDILMKLDIT